MLIRIGPIRQVHAHGRRVWTRGVSVSPRDAELPIAVSKLATYWEIWFHEELTGGKVNVFALSLAEGRRLKVGDDAPEGLAQGWLESTPSSVPTRGDLRGLRIRVVINGIPPSRDVALVWRLVRDDGIERPEVLGVTTHRMVYKSANLSVNTPTPTPTFEGDVLQRLKRDDALTPTWNLDGSGVVALRLGETGLVSWYEGRSGEKVTITMLQGATLLKFDNGVVDRDGRIELGVEVLSRAVGVWPVTAEIQVGNSVRELGSELFIVGKPKAPWAKRAVWIEVLARAARWAHGKTADADILAAIEEGIHRDLGNILDYAPSTETPFGLNTLDLFSLLRRLSLPPDLEVAKTSVNCLTVSRWLACCGAALGVRTGILRISTHSDGAEGPTGVFPRRVLPLGSRVPKSVQRLSFHDVVCIPARKQVPKTVYDGCLILEKSESEPKEFVLGSDLAFTDYHRQLDRRERQTPWPIQVGASPGWPKLALQTVKIQKPPKDVFGPNAPRVLYLERLFEALYAILVQDPWSEAAGSLRAAIQRHVWSETDAGLPPVAGIRRGGVIDVLFLAHWTERRVFDFLIRGGPGSGVRLQYETYHVTDTRAVSMQTFGETTILEAAYPTHAAIGTTAVRVVISGSGGSLVAQQLAALWEGPPPEG